MSNERKISAVMGGFTPIFDAVVADVGLVGAGVFGRIWRYCQMEDGICRASHDTIAAEVGLSRRTVLRWCRELCEAGYLEDLTPHRRNWPHVYRDTGKVAVVAHITTTVTESHTTEPDGVTESHSRCDRESLEETSLRDVKDDDDDGLPAAETPNAQIQSSTPPGYGLSGDVADSYWTLRYIGVDADVARAEAVVRDPGGVIAWSYVIS